MAQLGGEQTDQSAVQQNSCPVTPVCVADVYSKTYSPTGNVSDMPRDWLGRRYVEITGTYVCTACDGSTERVQATFSRSFWFETRHTLTLHEVEIPRRWVESQAEWVDDNAVPHPFNPVDSGLPELESWAERQLRISE